MLYAVPGTCKTYTGVGGWQDQAGSTSHRPWWPGQDRLPTWRNFSPTEFQTLCGLRHEKSLKMSAHQIFRIWTVHTFFRYKLPIYENLGDERPQNVTDFDIFSSIRSICLINVWLVANLFQFWHNVHNFSHKYLRTRFARFAGFFMSAYTLW